MTQLPKRKPQIYVPPRLYTVGQRQSPPQLGATEKVAGVGEPKNQQMPTIRGTFIQVLCQALHIISLNSCSKPMKAGATTPPSHFTDEELEGHRG